MIKIYDQETHVFIGEITEEELDVITTHLVSDSSHPREYGLNNETLRYLELQDASESLIEKLRAFIGDREDRGIIYRRFGEFQPARSDIEEAQCAYLILPGSGGFLCISTFESIHDDRFTTILREKGITKFIAFNIPVDLVKKHYGVRFKNISEEITRLMDFRVLDYNGYKALNTFSFEEMGEPELIEN